MKTLWNLTIFGLTLCTLAVIYTAMEYLATTIPLPDNELIRREEVSDLSIISKLTENCKNNELIRSIGETMLLAGDVRRDGLVRTNKWNELTAIIRILLWVGAGAIFYVMEKRIKAIADEMEQK